MNQNQITAICATFNLGTPIDTPSPVHGGLLHSMWRLNTTLGSYAVKQLTTDITLTPPVRHNYELSEQIASTFKTRGIPAICAFMHNNTHLFDCENNTFLVYPWVNAQTLPQNTVSKTHAIKIAHILTQLHTTNLHIPGLSEPQFDVHTNAEISALIEESASLTLPYAHELQQHKDDLLTMNDAYQSSISTLKKLILVSHADLDQKNVLWDNQQNPILIDWESARNINPTQEIINAAFDWSGITTDSFSTKIFFNMIIEYKNAGGAIESRMVHAALGGIFGNWINWMLFNMQRSIKIASTNSEDAAPSIQQVHQTLQTMIRLENFLPDIERNILCRL